MARFQLALENSAGMDWYRQSRRRKRHIVGREDFLDFLTAVFDGQQVTLELRSNGDIPLALALAS
jgi:hypothetical protein